MNKIQQKLKNEIVHFGFDSFYKEYFNHINDVISLDEGVKAEEYDFDHPSSLDFDEAYKCLKDLKEKRVTYIPKYCFKTNARLHGQGSNIEPKEVVIIEGILSFFDPVSNNKIML